MQLRLMLDIIAVVCLVTQPHFRQEWSELPPLSSQTPQLTLTSSFYLQTEIPDNAGTLKPGGKWMAMKAGFILCLTYPTNYSLGAWIVWPNTNFEDWMQGARKIDLCTEFELILECGDYLGFKVCNSASPSSRNGWIYIPYGLEWCFFAATKMWWQSRNTCHQFNCKARLWRLGLLSYLALVRFPEILDDEAGPPSAPERINKPQQ